MGNWKHYLVIGIVAIVAMFVVRRVAFLNNLVFGPSGTVA